MGEASIIGIDLAKRSFQVHGARADGSVAYRRKLSRGQLLSFLASQPKCTVAMEACAGAHYWGRQILALGHEVRLVPPIYVKPFVKRCKNDAADAEAITEAAQRPTMRFVAVKTEAQQAQGMLFRTRDLLVRQRTQTINALRVTWPSTAWSLRRAGPGSCSWPGFSRTRRVACRRRSSSGDGCCSSGSPSSTRRSTDSTGRTEDRKIRDSLQPASACFFRSRFIHMRRTLDPVSRSL